MSQEITVTITTTVDPSWIELCTKDTDLFLYSSCGSFLFGMEHDPELGWLVFEHAGDVLLSNVPGLKAAKEAWMAGKPLPPKYHRLNVETATKAWVEGVKWRGEKWYEKGDAIAYQYVIQKALFGEERYC